MAFDEVVYDVFLSHRGRDVKRNFCAFLSEALRRAGVRAFVDEVDLRPGDKAWPTMQTALESALLVLPIFSTGYATSQWCLEEPDLMMRTPHKVIPVFFDVTPDLDMLVEQLPRMHPKCPEKIQAWADALKAVSSITGWRADQANGHMPTLVSNIVKGVLERLGRPALHIADVLVDLDSRVASIKAQLANELLATGSAVLGLYGMGGIGKTTLAKAVYNDLHPTFAGRSCFLEVGREAGPAALQQLQQDMLKELCGIFVQIGSLTQGKEELQHRLVHAHVLVVIDDIWTPAQRDALLVPVGWRSIVLLTTRDEAMLLRSSILRQRVELLSSDAALELFSWHAFLASKPPAGLSGLATSVVSACGCLPLTLAVIGSHLWNQQDSSTWEQALIRLQRAKPLTGGSTADDKLWGKLKLSYDALDGDEQEVFLDIACFMLGKHASSAMPAWGCLAQSTMQNLKHRSLLSEDADERLTMHNQIRDMGQAIVQKERKHPRQRSRAWMPEAQMLLEQIGGVANQVEALSLRGSPEFCTAALESMVGLRLLDLDCCRLDADTPFCRSLLYLEWHAPTWITALPVSLIVLDLSHSDLETLPESIGALTSLVVLDLEGCASLAALPDSFITMSGLRRFSLSRCGSLAALPPTIGALARLEVLDASGCRSLCCLPESLGGLAALKTLNLRGCSRLAVLPETLGALTGLTSLALRGCGSLVGLPESLGALMSLTALDLSWCGAMMGLPASLGSLTALTALALQDCGSLAALPVSVGALTGLKVLDTRGCAALKTLPGSLGLLSGISALDMSWCSALTALPDSLATLRGLTSLSLRGCGSLTTLPEGFGNLTDLTALCLRGCRSLTGLPESLSALSALTMLDLSACSSLAALPAALTSMTGLMAMDLSWCGALSVEAEALNALTGLTALEMQGCGAPAARLELLASLAGQAATSLRSPLSELSVGSLAAPKDSAAPQCSSSKERPPPEPIEPLADHPRYLKVRDLDKGTFGFVQLAKDMLTEELVAIKFIELSQEVSKYVEREIANHKRLNHPHIIQLREVTLTNNHLGIVMEYAAGGNLYQLVAHAGGLPEPDARWFFQQIICAVDYCHDMGVCNRDLKLENTLLTSSKVWRIKLCDFGYSKAADAWSCGVMLYVMLTAQYPFGRSQDSNMKLARQFHNMLQRILNVDYNTLFPKVISAECEDLLRHILVADPRQRFSVADIQKHPWFLHDLPEGYALLSDQLPWLP